MLPFLSTECACTLALQVLATLFLAISANVCCKYGFSGLTRYYVEQLRKLPFAEGIIKMVLDSEVRGAVSMLTGAKGSDGTASKPKLVQIPAKGISPENLMKILDAIHSKETAVEQGKAFAYTYTTIREMSALAQAMSHGYRKYMESGGSGIKSMDKLMADTWEIYMHTNALNPMIYPSLRKMETEIVSMTTAMLNGDETCAGSLTSGGTESILMAVKSYRDMARAKRPHVSKPNMVACHTVHPAFEKAAHYFNVEIIHVPVRDDARMDVAAAGRAIDSNTILLIGSAPQYAHGVVDPITELSDLAIEHGIPLHVDACFGGFMLPWVEKLGYPVPLWDYRVPGVTSISADIHKYGYSSKGASVITYRNEEIRSYQYFAYGEWPGGLFGSPSMAGSRPGGMIASAWIILNAMGQNGYMDLAAKTMETTQKLVTAIQAIPELSLRSKPDMTCIAIVSVEKRVNILAVADIMDGYGWKMERQQLPDSVHMTMMPHHAHIVDQLASDLRKAVKTILADPSLNQSGTTGMYGLVASIPDKAIVSDFIVKFFSTLFTTEPNSKSIVEEYGQGLQLDAVPKTKQVKDAARAQSPAKMPKSPAKSPVKGAKSPAKTAKSPAKSPVKSPTKSPSKAAKSPATGAKSPAKPRATTPSPAKSASKRK